jgi:hypothetical protein
VKSGFLHAQALIVASLAAFAAESVPGFQPSEKPAGILGSSAIKEASGLAASSRDRGFLWVINDSGSKPELHLIETKGRYRGKTTLSGARNVDWEDLASFQSGGKSYLLAADTGDNESKRDSCTLYVLNEPELPAGDKMLDFQSRVQWQIRFRYEDGPRDCESVAVDAASGKILLLSKRTEVPYVYELPLKPDDGSKVLTARRIGKTSVQAPTGNRIPFASQPTGFDLTPDASMAAVVTYYGVFVFPRKPGEGWETAFSRDPIPLGPHKLPQAEAIAFSKDGSTIFTISEGSGTPIIRFQRVVKVSEP